MKPVSVQSVYPEPVLARAALIADTLGVPRDRVLWAGALAAALQVPESPVAYPEMAEGIRRAVPFTRGLRDVTRAVAKGWFYGRHAWLAYFGMVERYEILVGILRLFAPELAEFELSLIRSVAEVNPPCPDTSSRAPSSRLPKPEASGETPAPKKPRRMKAEARKSSKPRTGGRKGRKPGSRNKPKPPTTGG